MQSYTQFIVFIYNWVGLGLGLGYDINTNPNSFKLLYYFIISPLYSKISHVILDLSLLLESDV